ncbi:MAG: TonB-dependent receptor [candidate division KSB1 bacterium]|nr:TonB-dependent receptor [candidate division KSB1 bacterium]MDZ7272573.1 TonB-dependent receptor [candidate division KSB1 bacterium]MDZ7284404.1 TonB-dependent receptor [candidate division KSB1 bacterium]MDZ7297200.1 TonB-dependent receptor [candidate division KSB1 bacterium]MDZ7308091.1 TonB-dependent receptor [candidate division KSB1 bacterium]
MLSCRWLAKLLILWGALLPAILSAQQSSFSGIIRDLNTHREIRGVSVYFQGTKIGTVSDLSGRFTLRLIDTSSASIVVFQHVAYETRTLPLAELLKLRYVYLQPRVIVLPEIEVREVGERPPKIARDLPQAVSLIDAKNFEIRGFVDAGDLLKTDHSVQVAEQLSGRKTVSIRGSNADEVAVLFNGMRLNSAYDNLFDLQMLDLQDLERLEVIKGSNTALYGADAFGGVINAVPRVQKDYSIRFQQRFGTYRSGNWGLHFFRQFNRLLVSYNFKRGASKRNFIALAEDLGLKNTERHHAANLTYRFPGAGGSPSGKSLTASYLYTDRRYTDQLFDERADNFNHILTVRYTVAQTRQPDFELAVSLHQMEEDRQVVSAGSVSGAIDNRALHLNAEKHFPLGRLDLLTAYQFEGAVLDFLDDRDVPGEQRLGLHSASFTRQHHGVVAIAKLHNNGGSDFLQTVDVDLSMRHDRVLDEQPEYVLRGNPADPNPLATAGAFRRHDWHATTFKFALGFSGYRNNLAVNGYLNVGASVKFPTLLQQISSPAFFAPAASQPNLEPEHNRSLELGASIMRDVRAQTSIYGWQVNGNFFQNYYANKFRAAATPGIPILFYDNVQNARISGIESQASVFLFRKKVTLSGGLARYAISEKAAFPFKSDLKRTLTLNLDHQGYSFQAYWFTESEQVGWLRRVKLGDQASGAPAFGGLAEVTLPGYSNLDLHLSKTFSIDKLKFFVNASGRNLINKTDQVLQGLAIRDRRYYLVLGAQY